MAEPVQPGRFDVLIRNARVMDGAGNPWLRADLGITGDRIFDPDMVRDVATYADPQKLAVGVSHLLVDGVAVLADGRFTDALPGRVPRK